jgi:hypothetical protein
MRPALIARLFGWAFVLRVVLFDTIELLRGHATHDYTSFHIAACAVRAGVGPYRPEDFLAGAQACKMGIHHPYLYPPLLAELMVPLTYLQLWTARLVWHVLIVAASVASIALLESWIRKRRGDGFEAPLFLIVAGSFWPIRESHLMGQVNPLVLLLLCIWWTRRERTHLAVIALAIAAAIKMSPALLFLVPIVERRWKELAYGVAYTTALVLLSCGLLGARGFEFLYGVVGGFLPGGHWHALKLPIDIFGNSSIAAVLMRLGHPTDPYRLPKQLALAQTAILGTMVVAWLIRQRKLSDAARPMALLILMVVAPTFAWEHHLTFALLAIGMLLASGASSRWLWVVAAAAIGLMLDRLDYYVLPPAHYPRWFLAIVRSPKLLSLLALFAIGLFAQKSQAGLSEATREKEA